MEKITASSSSDCWSSELCLSDEHKGDFTHFFFLGIDEFRHLQEGEKFC